MYKLVLTLASMFDASKTPCSRLTHSIYCIAYKLELPHHSSLRVVVDRMKMMGKYIYIDANMRGQMVLRTETSHATIKTYYSDLTPRFESMNEAPKYDNTVTVQVNNCCRPYNE